MAEMGNYCKAYTVLDLRKFSAWKENTDDLRSEPGENDEELKLSLNDDDVLYVQENYVVTHGIFKDEHIVYDDVTDEWRGFCHDELRFEIPDHAHPAGDAAGTSSVTEPRSGPEPGGESKPS